MNTVWGSYEMGIEEGDRFCYFLFSLVRCNFSSLLSEMFVKAMNDTKLDELFLLVPSPVLIRFSSLSNAWVLMC